MWQRMLQIGSGSGEPELIDLVPAMTSPTTLGFTASASAKSESAYVVFSQNESASFFIDNTSNAYIDIVFPSLLTVKGVDFIPNFWNGASYIKDFKILGSKNGTTFDIPLLETTAENTGSIGRKTLSYDFAGKSCKAVRFMQVGTSSYSGSNFGLIKLQYRGY